MKLRKLLLCLLVLFLIVSGATARTTSGYTPLHLVAKNGPSQTLVSNQDTKKKNIMEMKVFSSKSDENYFEAWLQLREIRRFDKIKDLLKKLTEEENVVAVKQTYNWLIEQKQQSSDKDYEGIAYQAICDFANNYFKGYPNRTPKPFLEMLENSSLDNCFRLCLIKCLDREYDEERSYFQAVCDSLIKMISNANEPLELRQTARSTISRLLGHQYYRVRMSQDELNRLSVKELLSFPKEKISPETEKRIKVLADNYNRYFWAVLSLTERDLTLYEKLDYGVGLSVQKKDGFVTDPALVKALDNTVQKLTLSKNEFIEGAKQVNEKIRKQKSQDEKEPGDIGWAGTAGYATCGFVEYYFRRFPEESPKFFLEMASDKNNDEDFRVAMLDILGGNNFYILKQNHLDVFSSSLISIAEDEGNSIRIRKKAIDCLRGQIGRLKTTKEEKNQVLQDINVAQEKYVRTLLRKLNELDLDPIVLKYVLSDLVTSLEKETESAPEIRKTLTNAVENYHRFHAEQWSHLAEIGLKTLHLPNMNDLLKSMIQDMDKIIAVQQDVKQKQKLESDREFINVKLLGNLSMQQTKQLVSNIKNSEEALLEAKRIVANPRSEGNRLHWETRVKDLEKQLKELKETLQKEGSIPQEYP